MAILYRDKKSTGYRPGLTLDKKIGSLAFQGPHKKGGPHF